MEILVARQPVFDRREQLYGYDLMVRRMDGSTGNTRVPLTADNFLKTKLDQVTGGRRVFLPVDRDMLIRGAARLFPADRVILQVDGSIPPDSELLEACSQLVWSGYRFSITSRNPAELKDELLRLAEIVKVDIAATDTVALPDVAGWLRTYNVCLLAAGVRHRVERDGCAKLGFELFEGYRFAAPASLPRHDRPGEQVMAFGLLKMVRDPRVLGRDQVARWLTLLPVTNAPRDSVRGELMNLSLTRARMCELLAEASGTPHARGPLFLVGILSALDQLVETPLEALADSLALEPDVRAALLHREDFYGAALGLVEAYEQGSWDQVDALSASVGLNPASLPPLYLDALAWASENQRPDENLEALA